MDNQNQKSIDIIFEKLLHGVIREIAEAHVELETLIGLPPMRTLIKDILDKEL